MIKGGKVEETKLDSNDTLLTVNLNTPLKKEEVIRYINVILQKKFQLATSVLYCGVNALFVQFDH